MTTKFINNILLLSTAVVIIITSLLVYISIYPLQQAPTQLAKEEQWFCGTADISPEKQKGREIFNTHCAACHRINAKSTPDLIMNVFDRIPESYFIVFITNEDSLIKVKDPYNVALREEFKTGFSHNFKLSAQRMEYLIEYIK